jgi:hypothetical protein
MFAMRVLVGCVGLVMAGAFPVTAGKIVTGNIFVCRKPMMAGETAAIRLMKPPSNMVEAEREKRKLAELQRDQAENCFYVSKVEIMDSGGDKIDIGWGQWCQEFTGNANGEEVFVAFGSVKKQFGSCP